MPARYDGIACLGVGTDAPLLLGTVWSYRSTCSNFEGVLPIPGGMSARRVTYYCPVCKLHRANTKVGLIRHCLEEIHENARFICRVCNRSYSERTWETDHKCGTGKEVFRVKAAPVEEIKILLEYSDQGIPKEMVEEVILKVGWKAPSLPQGMPDRRTQPLDFGEARRHNPPNSGHKVRRIQIEKRREDTEKERRRSPVAIKKDRTTERDWEVPPVLDPHLDAFLKGLPSSESGRPSSAPDQRNINENFFDEIMGMVPPPNRRSEEAVEPSTLPSSRTPANPEVAVIQQQQEKATSPVGVETTPRTPETKQETRKEAPLSGARNTPEPANSTAPVQCLPRYDTSLKSLLPPNQSEISFIVPDGSTKTFTGKDGRKYLIFPVWHKGLGMLVGAIVPATNNNEAHVLAQAPQVEALLPRTPTDIPWVSSIHSRMEFVLGGTLLKGKVDGLELNDLLG